LSENLISGEIMNFN